MDHDAAAVSVVTTGAKLLTYQTFHRLDGKLLPRSAPRQTGGEEKLSRFYSSHDMYVTSDLCFSTFISSLVLLSTYFSYHFFQLPFCAVLDLLERTFSILLQEHLFYGYIKHFSFGPS